MARFEHFEPERVVAEDELFVVVHDKYPVSPGHLLVVVKRPVARFQNLTAEEKRRLLYWMDWCLSDLQSRHTPAPDGFNIGLNDGPAAGQTVGQLHLHIIPRYEGDVSDPRGGVRHVIPHKAKYWR